MHLYLHTALYLYIYIYFSLEKTFTLILTLDKPGFHFHHYIYLFATSFGPKQGPHPSPASSGMASTLTFLSTHLLSPHSCFTNYNPDYQVRKRISNGHNCISVNSSEGTHAEGWPVKIVKSSYSPQIFFLLLLFHEVHTIPPSSLFKTYNSLFCNNYRLTGRCKNSTGSLSFPQW